MKTQTVPAYAKLNLTLDILGKRPDGYHELRMVMQTVSLCDDVTVTLTDGTGVACRVAGAELPCDERNLAVKAANAFCEALGYHGGIDITLTKRIPSEAGMAGGSADAAAVLFCVRGGTQLAEGRGERLTALRNAPRLYAAVCKPDFPISTPALFQRSDRVALTDRPDTAAMLAALEAGDAAALCASVKNVFEQVLPDEQRARIEDIKHALLVHGAECAAMTGSGSAVFGLFREEDACRAACGALRSAELQTFCTIFV